MPKERSQRVALYARVSDPRGGRQHPDIQLSELRDYARHRGWEVLPEFVYVDRLSGSRDSRPELNRLMADARRRRFNIVLVWKLDRLGRSLRHLVNTLAEFESLGIALVSMRESLDLSVPAGRLMFQIIGAMAEFERGLISERVTAGMRHAKTRGIHVGRPSVSVDSAKIRELRESGLGWREIAAELKVSVGTLYNKLHTKTGA
jgi:DNA invertase Pin-like site-specific DNA recombinase